MASLDETQDRHGEDWRAAERLRTEAAKVSEMMQRLYPGGKTYWDVRATQQ